MICQDEMELFYEDEQFTQNSTSIDEEQEEKEDKKKKKRKLKDLDFCSGAEEVVQRLNEMVIMEEKRLNCGVSQEWMKAVVLKYGKN